MERQTQNGLGNREENGDILGGLSVLTNYIQLTTGVTYALSAELIVKR